MSNFEQGPEEKRGVESTSSNSSRVYVFAGVLAALAGALAWGSLKRKQAEISAGWQPKAVLVASRDVPAGTVLDSDMLQVQGIPEQFVTDSIVPASHRSNVVDGKLVYPMKLGDILNFHMLQGTRQVENLSKRLVPGVRAVSLRVGQDSSVNRMVRPNDHIDLLLTFRDPSTRLVTTMTLLENVVVLATGDILGGAVIGMLDQERRRYGTITVELQAKEAELAVQAQAMGNLYATLRHPDDQDVLEDRARTSVETVLTGERAAQLQRNRKPRSRLPQVIKGRSR